LRSRSAVLHEPQNMRIEDVELAELGPDEILIEVKACGLCVTDVKRYAGKIRIGSFPVIMGHEFSGKVVETGDGARRFVQGDSVVVEPDGGCGACYMCKIGKANLCTGEHRLYGLNRNGGYAKYCVASESDCYRIPQGMSYEAAALSEPVACAIHAVDVADVSSSSSVAIVGAGFMGLLITQLLKASKVGRVIVAELKKDRLEAAKVAGADLAINSLEGDPIKETREATDGRGADVVIEAVGNIRTLELATKLARQGGKTVIFGVPPADSRLQINPFDLLINEQTITSSFCKPNTFERAIAALQRGVVMTDRLITSKYALEDIVQAMDTAQKAPEGFIKAIIQN
jgi:L-iditol 2-dehydrogenase